MRRLPAPATIIALIALFVALSTNSTASSIVHKSLTAAFSPLSSQHSDARGPRGPRGPRGFRGFRGPQGTQGPQGVQGPQGPAGQQGAAGAAGAQGIQGPAGISGYQVVLGPGSPNVAPGAIGADVAVCPAGKKAIGGGFNTGQQLALSVSIPTNTANNLSGWVANGKNVGLVDTVIVAYAVCATVTP
jgi:hypothetical protein